MDALEHEVVADEPGEEGDKEDHTGGGILRIGKEVVGREREQVEFEIDCADQVEEHLGVGPGSEHLRVCATAEIEIGPHGTPPGRCRQHYGGAHRQAERESARYAGPAMLPEPVPRHESSVGGGEPQTDADGEHQRAVEPVTQQRAALLVTHIPFDATRREGEMQPEYGGVDDPGRKEPCHMVRHVRSFVFSAMSRIAVRRGSR